MDMLPVILIGLVLLLGLVAMGLSYKTWPIYTMILLFFNLVAAGGFVYLGARTLKTYNVWRTEQIAWQKTVNTLAEEVKGREEGTGEGDDALSLADLQTRLARAQEYRGNIWALIDADSRRDVLKNQAPLVANISSMGNDVKAVVAWKMPFPPKFLELAAGKKVYLFGDPLADPPGKDYLGHYSIDAIEGKDIKLTRVDQLMEGENVTVNNRPVLIYETFPNDDYRAFAGMTLPQLKKILPDVPDETLQEYVKHGKPVTAAEEQALLDQQAIDDEAKTQVATLNKGRVWYRVRVKELLPISEVSGKVAAAPPEPMPGEDNPMPMDEEPAAALPTTFGIGTKIVLDPDTAKQLVAAGKVVYDGDNYRVYMRPLRDYPNEYNRIRQNVSTIRAAIAEVERLEKLNAQTIASTEATIKQHEARTALVNEDLGNLKKETTALTAYDAQIRQRTAALRAEEAALLKNIAQTAAAITQFQMEALRKVNSRISAQDQAAAVP